MRARGEGRHVGVEREVRRGPARVNLYPIPHGGRYGLTPSNSRPSRRCRGTTVTSSISARKAISAGTMPRGKGKAIGGSRQRRRQVVSKQQHIEARFCGFWVATSPCPINAEPNRESCLDNCQIRCLACLQPQLPLHPARSLFTFF